jgi:hypothetical protein
MPSMAAPPTVEMKNFSEKHKNTSHQSWQNPYGLVHVVQTRFMQLQPGLVHLARARLRLFQVFCLPLLRHSSGSSFLWMIRTDPNLDSEVLSELLELLRNSAYRSSSWRVLVVASNENPKFVQERPDRSALVWGSFQLWQSYYAASLQQHTVLETRLDADDGLSVRFVEDIQQHVHVHPLSPNVPRIYCVRTHLEWEQEPQSSSEYEGTGLLLGLRSKICVTPGLTYVYPPGSASGGVANSLPIKHHQIHYLLPACKTINTTEPCLVRLSTADDAPLAIRARSVTSAGMLRVVHGNYPTKARDARIQNNAWNFLVPQFGVTRDAVTSVKVYLEGPERDHIVQEALAGQCTAGHSCKTGSKLALEYLLHQTRAD